MSVLAFSAHAADEVTGAGASFPAPIYSKWAEAYNKATGNKINYQSVGSGAGIKQINAKTVDFGASDMPLKDDELASRRPDAVPDRHRRRGAGGQHRRRQAGPAEADRPVLADIYLGKITKWNDAGDHRAEPGRDAAGRRRSPRCTAPTARAPASSSPNYLSKVNADWKAKVGEGTAVNWPSTASAARATKACRSTCSACRTRSATSNTPTPSRTRWTYVQLKNQAGTFVEPDDDAFKAAAAGADWSQVVLPGADRPAGQGFVADHRRHLHPDAQGAGQAGARPPPSLKFFDWAYANGDKAAADLDYVPLPDALKAQIRKAWDSSHQGRRRQGRRLEVSKSPEEASPPRRPPTAGGVLTSPEASLAATLPAEPALSNAKDSGRSAAERRHNAPWGDALFSVLAHSAAWLTLAILAGIIGSLVIGAMPAMREFGLVLPVAQRVGSGAGPLRRPGHDLRHAGDLGHRAADRRAGELRHRAVPHRDVARAGSSARWARPSNCWPACRPSSTACGA